VRAPVALFLVLFSVNIFAAEVPVSETARYDVAESTSTTRYAPTIASGDEGFLVVWEERVFAGYPGPVSFRAYDVDGVPRQPAQTSRLSGFTPRAVWTGSEYLLVHGGGSRFGHGSIYSVRIASDGTLLGEPVRIVTDTQTSAYVLDLKWDGLDAWALVQYDGQSHLVQLDASGRMSSSRTAGSATAIAPNGSSLPWMLDARDGDLAALRPGGVGTLDHTAIGEVFASRTSFGTVLDAFTIAPAGANIRNLAWDGAAWIAAYATEQSICTLRFTSAADLARDCNDAGHVFDPWIAAGPHGNFMAWTEGDSQWGAGHARVMTTSGIASIAVVAQLDPVATIDPTGLLVAWIEASKIHLGGFTNDGVRRAEQVLDTDPVIDRIGLAAAGAQSLLVYIESGVVRASIIDARGIPSYTGIPLDDAASLRTDNAPRVLAAGNDWLVTWRTDTEVVSMFVTRNGSNYGLQHYEVAQDEAYSIAATNDGFLLVHNHADQLLLERIDHNGFRIGSTSIDTPNPSSPVIGCGNETCLVTWSEETRKSVVIRADGTRVTDIMDLGIIAVPSLMVAQPGGDFLLYAGSLIARVGANGALIGESRWTGAAPADLGAVVEFRGRLTYVYSRSGRVYAFDVAPRGRAVRH
jgi:hypothetical protein